MQMCTALLWNMPRSAAKSEKCRGSLVSAPAPEAPSVEPVVDIIPTRLTGDAWLAVLAQEEGEEVVTEIIQQLESTVLDKCCQVYLQKQVCIIAYCVTGRCTYARPPHTHRHTSYILLSLIQL